jgi:hypothetical protein
MLAGVVTPAALVLRIQARGSPRRSAELLECLLRLGDDDLAARAVLQAILPALSAKAVRARRWAGQQNGAPWPCLDDLSSDLVACAWEEIRRPHRETSSFPAEMLVDAAWRRLRSWVAASRLAGERTVPLAADDHQGMVELEDARSAAEQVTTLLIRAVRSGQVELGDARLVFATRVVGVAATTVAAAEGYRVSTVHFARAKAERAVIRACA